MPEQEIYQPRSEEVQEILGTPPSWLVQWGTTLIVLTLGLLVFLAWYIKIPETLDGRVTITTLQPPIPVIAPDEGYIAEFWVEEGDSVGMNALLGLMVSAADYQDVLQLEGDLKELQAFDQAAFSSYLPRTGLRLGELQPFYNSLTQIIQDFTFKEGTNYDRRSINQIREQIDDVQSAIYALEKKLRNARQAKALAQQQLEYYHNQYKANQTNLPELHQARQVLLDKEGEIAGVQAEMAEKREQIDELNVQILAIKQGASTDKMTKFQQLQQSLSRLSAEVENWKRNYLIIAPAEGIVSFYDLPRQQQYVRKSDKVMAIIPYQETDQLIGQLELPVSEAGKVKSGQKVRLKLDDFPFRTHGIVRGFVEEKALLPRENGYFIRIALPNGLQTSSGGMLPFRQQMQGKAEIITEYKRLLDFN